MAFGKLRQWWRRARSHATSVPASLPGKDAVLARDFGGLWSEVQEIAREESPEVFDKKPASQHAAESLEGKKDVERWLEIYRMRVNPERRYRFPEHHRRHRGLCLIPRQWPWGTSWEAFDEETLLKAGIPPQPTREELMRAIDRWLDGE